MECAKEIIQQQATEALRVLDVQGLVSPAEVAESVLRQAAYWEKPLPDGSRLLFVRLFSPVVMRGEVFLGNVLFNAFLGKTFARAVAESDSQVVPLANDLENYYCLVRTSDELSQLAAAFRAEVERSLPDLFFDEPDEAKGICGSLETMLDFDKANVEPFPVFIMPQVYAGRLERAVRTSLLRKIEKNTFERNPTSIMANLAFFYCHDGTEMQSPSRFLAHLAYQHFPDLSTQLELALNVPQPTKDQVTEMLEHEVASQEPQKSALAQLLVYIEAKSPTPSRFGWVEVFFSKTDKGQWALDAGKPPDQKPVVRLLRKVPEMTPEAIWDDILKNSVAYRLSNVGACSSTALKLLFRSAVEKLGEKADVCPTKWQIPYIRNKFLEADEQTLVGKLLSPAQLGYTQLQPTVWAGNLACRVCGVQIAEAEDKSILMGQNTHKFHNQSGKQKGKEGPKTCLRCATFTYLMVKLLGSEAVGQPQVPKTYNLIFHYGKHSDAEVAHLTQQIDRIWDLVRQHRAAATVRGEVSKAHKALAQKLEQEHDAQKRAALEAELAQKQTELRLAQAAVAQVEEDEYEECPWMRDTGASPVPSENPALDVIGNLQLSESKVERHVLGLGMGGYRMILFVLPQIRAPRDAKEHDFAQSRFSNSWVTVTAFLSFLHDLCGCDGPFYYQSLPTLNAEAFQSGTFYIHNQPISAQEAQSKYAAVYQLAWRLVWQRGAKGFVKKVVLAEKLLADPLGEFSAVMRDSPILGQRKGEYKRLRTEYRKDWGAQDLIEYARFIQELSNL